MSSDEGGAAGPDAPSPVAPDPLPDPDDVVKTLRDQLTAAQVREAEAAAIEKSLAAALESARKQLSSKEAELFQCERDKTKAEAELRNKALQSAKGFAKGFAKVLGKNREGVEQYRQMAEQSATEAQAQQQALKQNLKALFMENQKLKAQLSTAQKDLVKAEASVLPRAVDTLPAAAAGDGILDAPAVQPAPDAIASPHEESTAEGAGPQMDDSHSVAGDEQEASSLPCDNAQCASSAAKASSAATRAKHLASQLETVKSTNRKLTLAMREMQQEIERANTSPIEGKASAGIDSQAMNQRMIVAIQAKDGKLRVLQDELDSVLQKLAGKEQDILLLREEVQKVAELTKVIKDKDAKLARRQAVEGKSIANSTQVRKLTEALTAAESSKTSMEEQVKAAMERAFLATKSLQDANKLVEATEDMCQTQKEQLEQQEQEFANFKQDAKERESQLTAEAAQFKELQATKFKQAQKEWKEEIVALAKTTAVAQERVLVLEEEASHHKGALAVVRTQTQQLTADLAESRKRTAVLERSREQTEAQMSDAKLNEKIESKKRNRLVEELKKQLKKDALRVRELEAALAEAKDGMMNAEKALLVKGALEFGSTPSRLTGLRGISQRRVSTSSTHSTQSTTSNEVLEEVSAALSKKFAALKDENYIMKQKLFYLEQNCRLLNEDIIQKKAIIGNYLSRIQSGALTTAAMTKRQQINEAKFNKQPEKVKMALFSKMEIVLQETSLQNMQYKEHLKTMGLEVSKLIAQIADLEKEKGDVEDELVSTREMYTELRDRLGVSADKDDGSIRPAPDDQSTAS